MNFCLDSFLEFSANQRVELSFRFFFEPHFNDSNDDLLRIKESSVIRDKDRSRELMNRQAQMFERSSQRKRFDFEQMKKNFSINSIEASEQMKQSSLKRRDRSFEREKRERRENNRDVKDDARDDARADARDSARDNVEGDIEGDVEDETNVPMKNVF